MESAFFRKILSTTSHRTARRAFLACALLVLLWPLISLSNESREDVYYVPLVGLLTNPERFDGSLVRAMGFLKYDGQLRLYLTRDHAEIGDRQSSVVVVDTTDDASLTESSCALKYVSVTARFRRFPDRSFGLIDVHDVFDRDSQEQCWSTKVPAHGGME